MLSVCPHDCPSCCSLVVTVEAGRLTSVTGNAEHPFTRGVICGKVREYAERVHSPLRVLTPLRRVGPEGAITGVGGLGLTTPGVMRTQLKFPTELLEPTASSATRSTC